MFWAAFGYAAGIFSGHYAWRPPLWWLVATAALAASTAYLLRHRSRVAFLLSSCMLFTIGALTIQVRPPAGPVNFDPLFPPDGQEGVVTGHVTKEEDVQPQASSDTRQRLDVESEQIVADNQALPMRCGIRLTVYSSKTSGESIGNPTATSGRVFRYGERIRFPAKLLRPRNFRNPGAFDYRGYLAENGIVALASVKAENVELLSGFAGHHAELWRTRIYHSMIEQIHRLWPATQAALVDAMLIGDNRLMGHELLTDFQRTGTYHVLVISGLKVGILALVTFWLLRHLGAGYLASSAIAVSFTVAYALLTDVGAPVWRATLMLVLYLCAKSLYRSKAVLNTIGAAALALLLVDPQALFGASFQLSFLCVLIITAIGMPVLERTTRPLLSALKNLASTAYDFALPPALVQFRLDLRLIAGRLQRFVGARMAGLILAGLMRLALLACEFLVISIVIQIGFALPMAFYFHRATLVSLPANVFAVPLTEIALIASMLAIAVSYLSFSLAQLPAFIAGASLRALAGSVRWLGGLRIADTRVPTPGFAVILGCIATLVLAMVLARRRARLAMTGLTALAVTSLWISFVAPQPRTRSNALEVTAIDVGEGDSILLVSPQGRTLLVDAGGIPHWMHSELDIGEEVVSPYLWSRGIHQLDAVAVTHPHADHIGGMKAILANFHPRELWLAASTPNSELESLL